MARGCSICEPAPSAKERGSIPATAAMAVITIGRRRRRPAWIKASSAENPIERNFWFASSSRIPFFATIPTTMMSPINEDILNVVCVINRARNTPDVESTAEARIAMGAEKDRNSNSSTRKMSTRASKSTTARS